MRTTLSNSITFSSDGTVYSQDGQILNKSINPANAVHDSQKVNIGIRTNTSDFASFNTGAGPATQGSSTLRVQLHQPTGLVKVAGFEVRPEVAETLKAASPDLFIAPEVKQAEAAKASDAAREDEATREELGRHHDDTLEGYHQHLVGEVAPQALISLMVYGQRGETPPADLIKTIADQMGEPVGTAVDKVNQVIGGVHRQFTNLATALGVDPEKAAVWLKDHRKDTSMVASQAHMLRRDVRAWLPLLEDYRAATGDGRKH
jgi:hypothetical protein